MPFTVTQPLGRPPTFSELQALAGQHDVQIIGGGQAGEFCHPDPEEPKAKGNYAFEPNGDIRGNFTGNALWETGRELRVYGGKSRGHDHRKTLSAARSGFEIKTFRGAERVLRQIFHVKGLWPHMANHANGAPILCVRARVRATIEDVHPDSNKNWPAEP